MDRDWDWVSVIPTRDNFATLAWFEAREDSGLVVCTVHTGLDALLKHRGSPAWPKVVWELLDTPLVQMWSHLAVLVKVDTNCRTQTFHPLIHLFGNCKLCFYVWTTGPETLSLGRYNRLALYCCYAYPPVSSETKLLHISMIWSCQSLLTRQHRASYSMWQQESQAKTYYWICLAEEKAHQ